MFKEFKKYDKRKNSKTTNIGDKGMTGAEIAIVVFATLWIVGVLSD